MPAWVQIAPEDWDESRCSPETRAAFARGRGPQNLPQEFADELSKDLKRAGHPVSAEVALAAASTHLKEGKKAAMAVLVAAGVPMVCKTKRYSVTECSWFDVGKENIWIG